VVGEGPGEDKGRGRDGRVVEATLEGKCGLLTGRYGRSTSNMVELDYQRGY
jgi:hypothetical protein